MAKRCRPAPGFYRTLHNACLAAEVESVTPKPSIKKHLVVEDGRPKDGVYLVDRVITERLSKVIIYPGG